MKHGKRARLTLAKRKAARLAELLAAAEAEGGAVPWQIKTLLRRIAESEIHAEQASNFIDKLTSKGEVPTSADVAAAMAVHLAHVEKITRAMALVNQMRPPSRSAGGLAKFEIVCTDEVSPRQGLPEMVVDELTDADVERLRAARSEDGYSSSDKPVSARATDHAGDLPPATDAEVRTSVLPVARLAGVVRQWSGTVGGVQPDTSGEMLLVQAGDVEGGLELAIGTRVTCRQDGTSARDVRREPITLGSAPYPDWA